MQEETKDEKTVKKMCELFNSLMPGRLHIGPAPEWIPEHPEGVTNANKQESEFVQDTLKILVVCAGIAAIMWCISFWR